MAVVVGRMVAILEAQTAQFEARMSATSQQIARWNSATVSATRGTALLKSGFQQLAFEGLGNMPPALARVSSGLLSLVGPGGAMLAAIAVLGALSMAFEHAAKKAEELEEENRRVRDFQLQHVKMLGAIGPGMDLTPAEQLSLYISQRAGARAEINGLQAAAYGLAPVQVGQDPTEIARAANQRIDALQNSIRELDRAIQALDQVERRRLDQLNHLLPINALGGRALKIDDLDNRLKPVGPEKFPPREQFLSEIAKAGGKAAPGKFMLTPETAQMLLFSLMALQQGGPGSGMMALGGMATTLSGMQGIAGHAAAGPLGWIGFGISALSMLFQHQESERERNEERRHKELIGVLHEGPARITVIAANDPASDLYALRRQERLGGDPRLGGL